MSAQHPAQWTAINAAVKAAFCSALFCSVRTAQFAAFVSALDSTDCCPHMSAFDSTHCTAFGPAKQPAQQQPICSAQRAAFGPTFNAAIPATDRTALIITDRSALGAALLAARLQAQRATQRIAV